MSNFYLMRKDIPVCEFGIQLSKDDRISVALLRVFDELRLPVEMHKEQNIARYLNRRFAPTFQGVVGYNVLREGKPLATCFEDLLDYTGGFALIDDFWMRRVEDKTKNWDEYNLFSNEISEKLAQLAFTGEGTYDITEFVRSPEFTTDGKVNKAWRRIDGGTYLYKSSLPWKEQEATEHFSEYYASQMAERLNVNHVKYDLDMWLGQWCSVCELFTSENLTYISASSRFRDINGYMQSLDRDSSQYQQLADMILFDAITANVRHLGNFGFLQDNTTLELVGLAPIFDNGMALFGELSENELKNPVCESVFFMIGGMYQRARPEEIKAFLTPRQRNLAKEMVEFRFRRHDEINMSDERLNLLESIIQNRARFLSVP